MIENPPMHHLTVLVFPVREGARGHEFLMLRRVPRGGRFWQGVSGGVDPGETTQAAAERELFEETGLRGNVESIGYQYRFVPVSTIPHEEHVFIARVENVEPQISGEHDAYEWCGFERALRLLLWLENKEALMRAREYLSSAFR